VWFPMMCAWIVAPHIVLPFWLLFYVAPPFIELGPRLFSEPYYLITPHSCSFYGIDNKQKRAWGQLLFSMLRPFILVGALALFGGLAVHIAGAIGFSDQDIGDFMVNPVGFWHLAINTKRGNIVIYLITLATLVGTSMHILLTIPMVLKGMRGKRDGTSLISLAPNSQLLAEVQDLTDKICEAAHADTSDDQDRVAALEVETLSPFNVKVAMSIAVIDFAAYVYKIVSFSSTGHSFLAVVTTVSLVEAVITLLWGGHIQQAHKDIQVVSVTGVPTVHFLACCQWDDGLAGIPCLFITVYGLPLLPISTLITSCSTILFLLTGTRALAIYLQDMVDADMWSALKGVSEEDRTLLALQEAELLAESETEEISTYSSRYSAEFSREDSREVYRDEVEEYSHDSREEANCCITSRVGYRPAPVSDVRPLQRIM